MHITAEKIKEAAEALESTELKSFMFQEPTAGPLTRRRRSSRSTGRSRRSTRRSTRRSRRSTRRSRRSRRSTRRSRRSTRRS
ncbi:CotG/ExsB N-terminal domain-containing protein [Priestia megaterium]|uniref:CotG/ExsB N-terminal domain-containing protein n=1 Tax=Priestia megaterium TaxID=1404 RepID=UPI002FFDEAAC